MLCLRSPLEIPLVRLTMPHKKDSHLILGHAPEALIRSIHKHAPEKIRIAERPRLEKLYTESLLNL